MYRVMLCFVEQKDMPRLKVVINLISIIWFNNSSHPGYISTNSVCTLINNLMFIQR